MKINIFHLFPLQKIQYIVLFVHFIAIYWLYWTRISAKKCSNYEPFTDTPILEHFPYLQSSLPAISNLTNYPQLKTLSLQIKSLHIIVYNLYLVYTIQVFFSISMKLSTFLIISILAQIQSYPLPPNNPWNVPYFLSSW